jgi:hypothetical protein
MLIKGTCCLHLQGNHAGHGGSVKSTVFWVVSLYSSERCGCIVRIYRSHFQDLSTQSSHPCEYLNPEYFLFVCKVILLKGRNLCTRISVLFSLQLGMKQIATVDFLM